MDEMPRRFPHRNVKRESNFVSRTAGKSVDRIIAGWFFGIGMPSTVVRQTYIFSFDARSFVWCNMDGAVDLVLDTRWMGTRAACTFSRRMTQSTLPGARSRLGRRCDCADASGNAAIFRKW